MKSGIMWISQLNCVENLVQQSNYDNEYAKNHIKNPCAFFTKELLESLELVVVDKEFPSEIPSAERENTTENHDYFCGYHIGVLLSMGDAA